MPTGAELLRLCTRPRGLEIEPDRPGFCVILLTRWRTFAPTFQRNNDELVISRSKKTVSTPFAISDCRLFFLADKSDFDPSVSAAPNSPSDAEVSVNELSLSRPASFDDTKNRFFV